MSYKLVPSIAVSFVPLLAGVLPDTDATRALLVVGVYVAGVLVFSFPRWGRSQATHRRSHVWTLYAPPLAMFVAGLALLPLSRLAWYTIILGVGTLAYGFVGISQDLLRPHWFSDVTFALLVAVSLSAAAALPPFFAGVAGTYVLVSSATLRGSSFEGDRIQREDGRGRDMAFLAMALIGSLVLISSVLSVSPSKEPRVESLLPVLFVGIMAVVGSSPVLADRRKPADPLRVGGSLAPALTGSAIALVWGQGAAIAVGGLITVLMLTELLLESSTDLSSRSRRQSGGPEDSGDEAGGGRSTEPSARST